MKISIIGTNGFLSTAIAKYANENKWALNMYGVDQPVGHEYDKYYHVNLMETEIDCSTLLDSDIVVYAAGAGIQADLKENPYLIYGLNVTVPIGICNKESKRNYEQGKTKGYFGCKKSVKLLKGIFGQNMKFLLPYCQLLMIIQ